MVKCRAQQTVAFKIEINLLEIIICIYNLEEEVEEIEMDLESSARKNSVRCSSKQKKSITSETVPVVNTESTESDLAEVNTPRFLIRISERSVGEHLSVQD